MRVANILQDAPSAVPAAYAAWGKRAGAFLLDLAFICALLALLFAPAAINAWQDAYPVLLKTDGFISLEERQLLLTAWTVSLAGALAGILALWFYFTWTEMRWNATPAKKLLHLQTVSTDSGAISFKRAALRAFIKLFCASTVYPVLLLPLFTRKKQALHDFAAHTAVLQQNKSARTELFKHAN